MEHQFLVTMGRKSPTNQSNWEETSRSAMHFSTDSIHCSLGPACALSDLVDMLMLGHSGVEGKDLCIKVPSEVYCYPWGLNCFFRSVGCFPSFDILAHLVRAKQIHTADNNSINGRARSDALVYFFIYISISNAK